MSSSDDLRRVFAAPSFGIALKSADAVNRLNGKFPRSLAEVELPMGRGFIVRTGITSMLQIATPYPNDDDAEGAMDAWVRKIQKQYPGKKVTWKSGPATAASSESASAPEPAASGESSLSKPPPKVDPTKYDVVALKKQLLESGLPESLLSMLSEADIIENARSMGLLKSDEENEKPA
jgi:hypothetical protein